LPFLSAYVAILKETAFQLLLHLLNLLFVNLLLLMNLILKLIRFLFYF
jgi:hypothetical protein